VARGIVLEPAAAAVAEDLLLGQLLAGSGLVRLGRVGFGGEPEPAEGGHGPDHLQEVAPANADRREALREQVQLLVRNVHVDLSF
jgi:hypothetical protein